MILKCSNDHEIPEGGKFCGTCGEKAPAPAGDTVAKAVCGECQTEQSAAHKHCAGCGQPLAKALGEADVLQCLTELSNFHKAQLDLSDEIEVTPGEHDDTQALLAKAEPDENGLYDARALIEAQVQGHNANHDLLAAIGADVRADRRGQATIAKAVETGLRFLVGELKALKERVDQWEQAPKPPRSRIASVTPIAKASPATDRLTGQRDDSLAGDALWKACLDLETAPTPLLKSGTTTQVQYWANRGATLATLAEVDPTLGAYVQDAFARAATQRGNGTV